MFLISMESGVYWVTTVYFSVAVTDKDFKVFIYKNVDAVSLIFYHSDEIPKISKINSCGLS